MILYVRNVRLPPNCLPESRGNSERYRATKWAAYALECRAMLYAASEAKYGNVQLNGLVGIDANKADSYYAAAKAAAQAIINSGTFSLYKVYEDKAENFQNIFLDESSANTEKIFSKGFNGNSKGHSFDYYNAELQSGLWLCDQPHGVTLWLSSSILTVATARSRSTMMSVATPLSSATWVRFVQE